LIEVLIVVAITAMLSGIAIVYSHVGQSQISLSIEESKIAQLILEAKELSIATYSTDQATCAYGVSFDFTDQTYSLFAYNSAANSPVPGGRPICPSIASTSVAIVTRDMDEYAGGSWRVHVAQGVALKQGSGAASNTIQDVLFYPPDPCTLVSLDGKTFQSLCTSLSGYDNPPAESYVYLSTSDGSLSRTVTVNPAGQVSL